MSGNASKKATILPTARQSSAEELDKPARVSGRQLRAQDFGALRRKAESIAIKEAERALEQAEHALQAARWSLEFVRKQR